MDTLIQIAAAGGPIMLAVMGVIVSLSPPQGSTKSQRIWASSFALVGIISFFAIFNELRGTDQILGQIWDHIKETKATPSKEGARFVLSTGPITKEKKTVVVSALNKGDTIARVGAIGSIQVALSDHLMSEIEEKNLYEKAKTKLPPLGGGIDFIKDGGRSADFDVPFTDAQFDDVIAGKSYLYLVFVMSFRDEMTAPGKTLLASLCVHYQGKLDSSQVCNGHNESRQSD